MKKLIKICLAFIILFIFSGCGKKEDFYITYQDKNLYLNREYNVDDYGKYNQMFENESCAFGDKDITYIYNDLEIEAYQNLQSKMIVYSIYFTSDNIKTNEGIGLYDTINDAIKIYGNDYTKDNGKYTYIHGDTSLIFITQNEIIESIEYRMTNIG